MNYVTVKTQQELDTALDNAEPSHIYIESEPGVWLRLADNGRHFVVAWDLSSVEAWDRSSVVARDLSSVVARDLSSVVARDRSSVEAWDRSSVVARDRSSVVAWDRSSVVAWDRSSVVAWDRSSVVARGDSSVEARDRSSVEAGGGARVTARNTSTVTAGPHVALHLHSEQATVNGGVVIDLTRLDLSDAHTWCEYHGVTVTLDGRAVLYKAVDADLIAGRKYIATRYDIGSEVTATDWRADGRCGGGLHLSPHPRLADGYAHGPLGEVRYLRVTAEVASLRPLDGDKCKVPACRVECEVDLRGREIRTTEPIQG